MKIFEIRIHKESLAGVYFVAVSYLRHFKRNLLFRGQGHITLAKPENKREKLESESYLL